MIEHVLWIPLPDGRRLHSRASGGRTATNRSARCSATTRIRTSGSLAGSTRRTARARRRRHRVRARRDRGQRRLRRPASRRVPRVRAAGRRRRDRVARCAAVVQRQGRVARPVVGWVQRAADRGVASTRARGGGQRVLDRRSLLGRRPLHGRQRARLRHAALGDVGAPVLRRAARPGRRRRVVASTVARAARVDRARHRDVALASDDATSTGCTARSGSTRTRSRRRCSWSVDGRTATATRSCASSPRGRRARGRSSVRGVTAGRIACCPVRTSTGSRARCGGGGTGWTTTTTGSSAIPPSRRSCRTVGGPTSICCIGRAGGSLHSRRPRARSRRALAGRRRAVVDLAASRRRACTHRCGARMAIPPTSLSISASKMPSPPRSSGRSTRTCAILGRAVAHLRLTPTRTGRAGRRCGSATSHPTERRRWSPWAP